MCKFDRRLVLDGLHYVESRHFPAILLLSWFSGLACAQTPLLSLSSGNGAKGGSVTMNLSISSSSAPAALQFTLSYPVSEISSLAVAAGPALTGAGESLSCRSAAGSITCVSIGTGSSTISNGVVATVTAIISLAATSSSDSIPISNLTAAFPDGTLAAITGSGGIITLGNPVPTISSLSPANATAGTTAFTLAVNGTGFVNGSVVNWNGSARTTRLVSATQLAAAITAADIAAAGTAQVTVLNPAPGGGTSSAKAFAINTPNLAPSISSLSPSSVTAGAAAFNLAINGKGFVNGSVVNWNGSARTTTYTSATQLAAAITAADIATAGTAQITVSNPVTSGGTSAPFAMSITAALSFSLLGRPSEVTGVANGSTVNPTTAPSGLTGRVVASGSGTVNFAPDSNGNGVYFLSCCHNNNNAYYEFTGTAVGNIFNFSQGQISISLKSRANLAQRALYSAYRSVLDVRDGNPSNHLVYFTTQVVQGSLVFFYTVNGVNQYYYVPKGTEDTLFGSGVTMQVTITWSKGSLNLFLNGTIVKSSSYTPPTPNWTSASVFDVGAYEYLAYGGYDSCDDIIAELSVGPVTQH